MSQPHPAPPALRMIELTPDIGKATAWMLAQPRGLVRPGHDDGYGWHALLCAAFGDPTPRPFRLIERKNKSPQLLAYTPHDRATLIDSARLQATPAIYEALCIEGLAEKPMPAAFCSGQRLGFEVRVRPTVRQDWKDPITGIVDRRRSRERDAFLAALDADPRPRGERPEIMRDTVYRDWLARHLSPAADLARFEIAELKRSMLLRPRQRAQDAWGPRELVQVGLLKRGAKGEQGGSPDATFHGQLTVTDPAAFHDLLARGVGRHRSFGFGMLLLRPPRRT